MAVREIPTSFEHVCDACGRTVERPSKSRPQYWSNLAIGRDAYDYSGAAVADGSVHKLLCGKCSDVVYDAVNKAIARKKTSELTCLPQSFETARTPSTCGVNVCKTRKTHKALSTPPKGTADGQ